MGSHVICRAARLRVPITVDMGTHMKTTIDIADPILRKARAAAARRGQTLREVVEAALRAWLNGDTQQPKGFRMRDASVTGKGLRDGLRYDDWGKILDLAYGETE
jgi:hypothetical protein